VHRVTDGQGRAPYEQFVHNQPLAVAGSYVERSQSFFVGGIHRCAEDIEA
jgi:hypothetical protein